MSETNEGKVLLRRHGIAEGQGGFLDEEEGGAIQSIGMKKVMRRCL
jgi:hypothetical protein